MFLKAAPAQLPPFFLQAQLSPIFRQLFSRGCAGAGRRSHRSFCSCFLEAAQAQLLSIFRQLFPEAAQAQLSAIFGSCFQEPAKAQFSAISWKVFPRGCAGAAFAVLFVVTVFQGLRGRSSHQAFGSCFREAAPAQLPSIFRQRSPETTQA